MQNQLSATLDTLEITPANGESTDLSGGFISFDYFESLFSPHITASLNIIDTGSVKSNTDTQERPADIISALPIRGNDDVSVIFCHPTGRLTFGAPYPLKVKKVSSLGLDQGKKIINLKLVTPVAVKNKQTFLASPFEGLISNSVQKILTNLVPERQSFIDPTSNSLAFKGTQTDRPFDKIIDLATQSISVNSNGVPGYFFWESSSGMNFRSVQEIMNAGASSDYFYGNGNPDTDTGNNRILETNEVREFDTLSSVAAGAFKTDVLTWSPYTFELTEASYTLSNTNFETMGSEPFVAWSESADIQPRFMSFLTNDGNSTTGLSTARNNDPIKWSALSTMRYNSLFNQEIEIAVPLNLRLRAGQTMNVNFPRISEEKIEEGVLDQSKSGKYLILHLSHKFDSTPQVGSVTHLTLIRDTSGLHNGVE